MDNNSDYYRKILSGTRSITRALSLLLVFVFALLLSVLYDKYGQSTQNQELLAEYNNQKNEKKAEEFWTSPDIATLDANVDKDKILYG